VVTPRETTVAQAALYHCYISVEFNVQKGDLACKPPIAINLYVVKGMLGSEIEFTEVFQGTIPFIAADLINLVILYFIPGLALWLPRLMM